MVKQNLATEFVNYLFLIKISLLKTGRKAFNCAAISFCFLSARKWDTKCRECLIQISSNLI